MVVDKIFKPVMITCLIVIVVSFSVIQFVKASEQREFERQVQEMLKSDDPATVINGILLGEVKLEKLAVDSVSVENGIAKLEVSYAEPYSEEETIRTLSLFAVDIAQRVANHDAADSVEYTFLCPFINSYGQKNMSIGMQCTLSTENAAKVDMDGLESLLYENCLHLRNIAEVYVHPKLEGAI